MNDNKLSNEVENPYTHIASERSAEPQGNQAQQAAITGGTPVSTGSNRNKKIIMIMLAVILIVGGLVIAFMGGVLISFGACFKSECNILESGAPVYLPFVSLLVTVPIARKITKRH